MGWTSQTISSAPDEETALYPLRFLPPYSLLDPGTGVGNAYIYAY